MNTDLAEQRNASRCKGLIRKNMLTLALTTVLATSPATYFATSYRTALAAPVVGTSAAVEGDVFVSTQGAKRKAQIKQSIKLEDVVTTKQDSALQILLLDESTFTVGQNCIMTIDRFVYDPNTSSGEVAATVTQGVFRFMSGNIGKNAPTDASISTPTATIGIRGTFFEGVVGRDAVALAQLRGIDTSGASSNAASIIILRGPGPNANTLDKHGLLNISTEGGSVSIDVSNYAVFDPGNGQTPIGPFPVTEKMQEYLDFFLRSKPNGPSEAPIPIDDDINTEAGQRKHEILEVRNDEDPFEDLIDGIQDSLTEQFCTDTYGSFAC